MTDHYAVIGNPIAHSKSPLIHQMFAEQTAQDMRYEAILAPLDGFAETLDHLRNAGYRGCNVTVPFKFEAFNCATEISERARAAQAVNTLQFRGAAIFADNTDGAGLVRDMQHNLAVNLHSKQVLLLGAGGAAYGVVLPLLRAGAIITVVNRSADKAQQMAAAFMQHGKITANNYLSLAGRQFDVVINATSSGLSDEMPALPMGIFASSALAYDMMYGRDTPFLKFSRAQGATRISDGLGMLVEQAAESFTLWRGLRPDTDAVLKKLRA